MKTHDILTQRMMSHYIDQLHKLGYMDTDGLNYEELKQRLTIARMLHIDYDSPDNKWF